MINLTLLICVVGVATQVAQVVLLREFLAVFHGSELAIALVLGVWMFWTALGSGAGAWITRRSASSHRSLIVALLLLAAVIPGEVLLVRNLRAFFDVPAGDYLPLSGLLISLVVATAPVGLLAGVIFPLASRAAGAASAMYMFESLGCGIGGLALTFLFPSLDALFLAVAVGLLTAGVAVALTRRRLAIGLWLLAIPAVIVGAIELESWSHRAFWRNLAEGLTYVDSRSSRHGRIDLLEQGNQRTIFQQGHLVVSLPDRGESKPFAHVVMAQHPVPRRVLLIGGALSGMVKEILRHPVERLDIVGLDSDLIAFAESHLGEADRHALKDSRVILHFGDGRRFLQESKTSYDMIIVNAADPTTATANRYYTREFFREVSDHFAADGLFVLSGALSHVTYAIPEFLRRNCAIYATLEEVFPNILVLPGSTAVFLATHRRDALTTDEGEILARLAERGIAEEIDIFGLTERMYVKKINFELATGEVYNPLEESKPGVAVPDRINTDRRPIVYYDALLLWLHLTGDPLEPIVAWVGELPPWTAALPLLLVVSIAVVQRARRGSGECRRFPIFFGVVVAGFYGVTLEIVILAAFQSAFGYVFQYIGLLFALFMVGLAMGARVFRGAGERPGGMIMLQLCLLGLTAVAYGEIVLLSEIRVAHLAMTMLLILADGFLVGAVYPVAVRTIAEGRVASAGALYACDIAGGLIGALLAGALLLPLWGMETVLLLLAVCCLTSIATNLILVGRPCGS